MPEASWDDDTATWSVRARGRNGATTTLSARAVISAVGQLNRPHLPDIDGPRQFRRAGVPLRGVGPRRRPARQAGRHDRRGRQRLPDRARHRGRRRAPHRVPAHRAVDVPEPELPRPRSAPACSGRCGTCRSTAGGTASCCSGRAATRASRPPRVDPDYPDQQTAVSEINDITRSMFTEWITSQVGDDPELLAKVVPDYPATGKRTLQDNGSWLRTLTRDNVELVRDRHRPHRTRRGRHRRRRPVTRPTSSCTPPASRPTSCCGR